MKLSLPDIFIFQCCPCNCLRDGKIWTWISVSACAEYVNFFQINILYFGFIDQYSAYFVRVLMRNNYKIACFRHALQHVQQRRFCINPNEGFTNQLTEYEPIYKARLTLEKGQPSQDKGVLRLKS